MANGRSKLEERLARWLLMAHDRLDLDELSITHEILSIMLGVRRPGVTVALNPFERNGLIKSHPGGITIVDRKGLRRASNGAYGVPGAEFSRSPTRHVCFRRQLGPCAIGLVRRILAPSGHQGSVVPCRAAQSTG